MTTNIFIETLSRLKSSTTVSELAADFKREINYVVFKQLSLRSDQLVKKFNQMEKRYKKAWNRLSNQEWQEDERKLFLWFVLAYCKVFVKKFSEISESEWNQFSACFHHKSLLLLKYQVKLIEKNSERVHWDPFEEKLLNACIQSELNGKWASISKHIFFKSQGNFFKTPKQCREHWFNHMNKKIKKGEWSIQEDLIILDSVQKEGRKWARIVDLLTNQRTEHMIKNRFNSLMTCARRLGENNKNKSQEDIMNYLIDQLRQQSSQGLLNQSKYDQNGKKEHNSKIPEKQSNNNLPIQQNHQQANFINQNSLSQKQEQLDENASKKRSKNHSRFQQPNQIQTVVINPLMNMGRQQMFGMMTGVPILYGMPSIIPHNIMIPTYQHFYTMSDYSQPNKYFYKFE